MRITAAALVLVFAAPAVAGQASTNGVAPAKPAAAPVAASASAPESASSVAPAPQAEATPADAAPAVVPAPAAAALPAPPPPVASKAAALPPPPPPVAPSKPAYGKSKSLIPGALIGPKLAILSLPSPGLGLEVKVRNVVGLSFDYGLIPDVSIRSVKARYTDWRLGAKWYPWSGAFFVGAAYGGRTFKASATDDTTRLTVSAKVTSTFLAPEIGWRWVWNSGLFLGMNLGYQVILSKSTTLDIPVGIPPGSTTRRNVDDATDLVGKTGLPILSLVQLGFFF